MLSTQSKNLIIKYAIIIALILAIFLTFGLAYYITKSILITLILFIIIAYKLGKLIGTALMFPGCFKYYKGGIEIMYGAFYI